jgi:hypothetical protein
MAEFVSLQSALEPWFETPLDALPADIRDRVQRDMSPFDWDYLSPGQRKKAARAWDERHDPKAERASQLAWELVVRSYNLEREITRWHGISAPTGSEVAQKHARLEELQQQLDQTNWLLEHAQLVSPAHATTSVSQPGPRPPPKYLPFPAAINRLRERLATNEHELAAWIFMGPENGGIAAYRKTGELHPPPRFLFDISAGEDYIAPLMSCWFSEVDIDEFEPMDRFITGAALIQRWSKQADIQPESFIKAKVGESRLPEIHPTLGLTQASFPDTAWLPPMSAGLFMLDDVVAVEMESFGGALGRSNLNETPDQRRERLRQRTETLRNQGVRGFLKATAEEENISVARLKQIFKHRSPRKDSRTSTSSANPPAERLQTKRPKGWGRV